MEDRRPQGQFRLIRYFLAATLVAVLAATAVPVLVHRHGTADELARAGTDTAARLRVLANAIEQGFPGEIAALSTDSNEDRRLRGQTATLDQGIANLTSGLPPIEVRIHRLDGLVVYSTNREGIGKAREADTAVADAIATGKPSLRLIPRSKDIAGSPGHDWVESVVPTHTDSGEVTRVYELAADVTTQMDDIEASSQALILALLGAIGAAYVAMSLLVIRADRALARQYSDLRDVGRNLDLQNKRLQQEVEERSKAEEALIVAETRKAFILESALEAVITVDDQRRTVEYNNAARDIFGYSKEEVLGHDVTDLIIPEDLRGRHSAAFSRYLEDGVGRTLGHAIQVSGRRKSGEEFPLQIAITSFLLEGRRYFTAVMQDITARLEAEKIRDEGERALLDVIEASPVAIGITDHSGRLLYWNTQFFQMGRNYRDESGNHTFGLVFSQPSVHSKLLARVHDGERVLNEEAQLVLGSDAIAWVLVSMQNMVFEGKAAVLTWLYNITALKEQERALMEARNDAEKASRAKSDFLATMSHEIRTPMNGVVAMSEILDQTELTDGQRAMTTIIRDSAAVLLAIIDDVLDFSKIEAGRLDISPTSLSLSQIVEGVADLLGARSAEKGLELVAFLDPDVPDFLLGDPVRVRQVLLNLIGNAIKFTEKGHILVEVTMMGQQDDVAELLFRIIDTGPGIPADLHGQLFRPFVQADTSTARRFGGTGLGLSICKTLVELMGGSIGLDSVVGEGSTFWFRLSLPVLNERRLTDYADLEGIRVLVASSLSSQARALRGYLSHGHAAVAEATTAKATLAMLRENVAKGTPFDLVLLDNEVGDAGGLNLVREIASTTGLGTSALVLMLPKMAAFTFVNSQHEALFTTLSKPIRRSALCHAVAAAVGRMPPIDAVVPAQREGEGKGGRPTYAPPSPEEALARGGLILVAEDNPTNQTVIRMLLERLGFSADMAADGAVAWQMMQEKPYGLLLTDCHMPEVDGFQLARRVRQDEEERGVASRLPILALTADAISGTAQKCTDAGMDGYLRKPVSWAELDAAIQKWLPVAIVLREKGGRPSAPLPPPPLPSPPSQPPVVVVESPPPSPATADPVLDPAYLLELLGGDESMLVPMLGEYVDTTRPLVDELLIALESEDYEKARKKAHSCAGASRTAGAMEFAAICSTIEKAAAAGDPATALRAGEEIAASFERMVAATLALSATQG